VRNRASLTGAAREVFAAQGLEAPLDQIARQAGVGIATLYRHFPTRVELIDEILADAVRTYVAIADEALDMDDPWAGLVLYLTETFRLSATNRGITELMSMRLPDSCQTEGFRTELFQKVVQVVSRARDSGAARQDITVEDIVLLTWANAGLVGAAGDIAPTAWQRHLGLVLAGLKASAEGDPIAAPMTPEQVRAAMTARGRECTGNH
jgi:AcrR family transcriptional regulator